VGERGNYKNFFRFAEAAADILHQYKDLHLVLAGGGPLQIADALVIDRLKIGQRTHQFNVSDAQLNYLYRQAMVFVFPSLYEGFGYPILEAFKAGCPITASNTSCFPEIGGDAIAYFNPYDSASIYNSIASMLTNSNLCSNYIQKGSERLKLFPIQKQVQQTLDLYRELAATK
jgi:glycosyltransferase involved in cell wall biosynthesis